MCITIRTKHATKIRTGISGDLAIIAGFDTTSNAISNTLYFLMTNPTAYKRLQAEIDGLGDNVMDYAAQVHLPYLNGVL